jgi:hypothetical protein
MQGLITSYLKPSVYFQLLPATRYGKAHYRALEYARDQAFFHSNHDFDADITWPSFCRADLEWWLNLRHPVSTSFESPRFSIHMTTDASLAGWAAVVGDSSASGTWDEADSEDIALLEAFFSSSGLLFKASPAYHPSVDR